MTGGRTGTRIDDSVVTGRGEKQVKSRQSNERKETKLKSN